MKWLLDTDTCIAIIKKHPIAVQNIRDKSIGQVGISSITLGELAFGAARSRRPTVAHAALNEFLLPLEVAGFDQGAAMRYGDVRASLEQHSRPIDALVASHARALEIVLVTHNTREFARIEGLRLEDWTVP